MTRLGRLRWLMASPATALTAAGLNKRQVVEWTALNVKYVAAGHNQGDAAARTWIQFKQRHRQTGGKWVKQQTLTTEAHGLEFLEHSEVQNPVRLTPDRHAPRPTLANRLFHAYRQLDEGVDIWGVYGGHFLTESAEGGFQLLPYRGTGQSLRLMADDADPVTDVDAYSLVHELAEHEHARVDLIEAGRRNSARDEERISKVVQLGLDLLGDAAVDGVMKKRKKKKQPTGVDVLRPDATEGWAGGGKKKKGSTQVEISNVSGKTVNERPATKRYSSEAPEAGSGVAAPQPTKLDPDVMTVERAAREAAAVLMGVENAEALSENRMREISDDLFMLANQLEAVGLGGVVMDADAMLQVLDRVMEHDAVPGADTIAELRAQIESCSRSYCRISDGMMEDLARVADEIRAFIHTREYPDESSMQFADLLDLHSSTLSEARKHCKKRGKGEAAGMAEARARAKDRMLHHMNKKKKKKYGG